MPTAFNRTDRFRPRASSDPLSRGGPERLLRAGQQVQAGIDGTGSYLPQRVLDNAELERMVDTSHQWIMARTGIRERRIAAPHETTASMGIAAARQACQDAGIDGAELDLIIVATVTPDQPMPSTACLVQHELGAKGATAFDLNAACSGFLYASTVAAGMIVSGMHQRVMVIGAETLSRCVDYADRNTCVLFGDGAGAVVFGPRRDGRGILYSTTYADGEHAQLLCIPGGGSKHPASLATVAARQHFMHIEGRPVFKFATNIFVQLIEESMAACALTLDDVKLVIPHQVNVRIIDAAMRRLAMPEEKCFVNIDRYGNTSAASVPIALDEARRQQRLEPGDIVILLAFGAGLTWGATVVKM